MKLKEILNEIANPLAFKLMSSGKNSKYFKDGRDNTIKLWFSGDKISRMEFVLILPKKSISYENGKYEFFKETGDRSEYNYPAPNVEYRSEPFKVDTFLRVLEDRGDDIEPKIVSAITEILKKAK